MFQLPFALFMMRNSFEAVPRELEEAALVDGCTTFSALRRILLRAVRPALITVGLFAFLASWNDFFAPLILLSDGDKFTLPVAVVSMRERSFGAIDYGALEAGVMVMALPCVILFLVLQRHYVRGLHVRSAPWLSTWGRPVVPARGALRPLGIGDVQLDGGFWGERQQLNARRDLPHCHGWVERLGWIDNFRDPHGRRAGASSPTPTSTSSSRRMAWEVGRSGDAELDA